MTAYDTDGGPEWLVIPGSNPPRFEPVRFGLVFQSDRTTPGSLDQQATLRRTLAEFGFNAPRWRMLWYFARAYKAAQVKLTGGLEGARMWVNVSINGGGNFAFSNAIVLAQWSEANDLRMFFFHEWGHMFDQYVLTPETRLALMATIAATNTYAAAGNWFGDPADYFNRPREIFAWSFQRLCDPTLAELVGGYGRDDMLAILPDWDQAWVDAGFELP